MFAFISALVISFFLLHKSINASEPNEEITFVENYINLMAKLMNPNIDPCDDIFSYSCGNFNEKNFKVSSLNLNDFVEISLYNKTLLTNTAAIKAKDFYDSCIKQSDLKDFLCMKEFHEINNSWPAFEMNWTEGNFDWIAVTATLESLGIPTIFDHMMQYNDNDSIINIYPRRPSNYDKAEEVLQKLVMNEELIQQILDDIEAVSIKLSTIFSSRRFSDAFEILSLEEMQNQIDFNYIKYFEIYFNATLDESIVFQLHSSKEIREILSTLANFEPKRLANYIFWQVVIKYSEKNHCGALVFENFAPAIIASSFSIYFSINDEMKYLKVLNQFLQSIESVKNQFELNIIEEIISYVEENKALLEYKNKYFSKEDTEKEYQDLIVDPNNFYENIKNLKHNIRGETYKKYFSKNSDDEENRHFLNKLLRQAISSHNRPILYYFSVNYFQLWVNILLKYKFGPLTEEYESMESCLEEQLNNYNLTHEGHGFGSTIRAAMVISAAIQQTFQDYKKWLNEYKLETTEQEEIIQSKINLNNKQVFFISVIQNYCEEDNIQQHPVLISLLNNERFSEIFECSDRSRMNPKNRCSIVW